MTSPCGSGGEVLYVVVCVVVKVTAAVLQIETKRWAGQSGRGGEGKGWHTVWTACRCCSTPALVPNIVIM